jgi:chloride channel 7
MTHPVKVLREIETVGRVYDLLKKTNHNGFPVVDGYDPDSSNNETFGLLKGLILRHQLLTLLKKKSFLNNKQRLKPEDFREYYPQYINIDDILLSVEDKQLEIDLRPYMNLSPYSLTENSNLPRLFRLFRGLGLRHLVIVDAFNRVVGIVTRIDLARYRADVGIKSFKIKELLITA